MRGDGRGRFGATVFLLKRERRGVMQVVAGMNHLTRVYPRPVIAIGVFDGVHRGHQQVIGQAVARARAQKGTAMVMTFDPHPVHVLRPQQELPLIMSLSQRITFMEQLGVDVCVVIRFTPRFARMEPREFIRRFLVDRLHPEAVIVGSDFRFGKDRAGTLNLFRAAGQEYGFLVLTVPARRGRVKTVSSSRIREDVAAGRMARAAHLLGRPFSVSGRVVRGDSRGKGLGFPTANLQSCPQVIPPSGVYIVTVAVEGKMYPGMANVGCRPSFKRSARINIEAHVLDFCADLYGQEIQVFFHRRIRCERRFPDRDSLIREMRRDEVRARAWFARAAAERSTAGHP